MALPLVKNGRAPVIKLAHSFTALGSSNLPPLASLRAAAVKNTLPISAACHPLAPMYLPSDSITKAGIRFNNLGKAQGFAVGRGKTKLFHVKMKFSSPACKVFRHKPLVHEKHRCQPNSKSWCRRKKKFSIPCRQWNSAVQAREAVFCQFPTADECS